MAYRISIAHAHAQSVLLEPWPLPPASILEGSPEASGAVLLRSEDEARSRGFWRCTPGRFTWAFDYDETLVVLEGRATVQFDTGDTIELTPGAMAFFERGHTSTWTVHETILKGYHADASRSPSER
jgi:uncharacterized cupin superfamily protein